ncbi:MAG: hypothetical protein GY714_03730 [Desulfobacterales bacterium]|nr:hypothetical protein [Desulfobacterales bacterium]MCP4161817.1 hypothetical protein [Deltaproteobacteria bacterium]
MTLVFYIFGGVVGLIVLFIFFWDIPLIAGKKECTKEPSKSESEISRG